MHFHLEGTGYKEVFPAVVTAAHLVRISDALVPGGVGLEGGRGGGQLQVKVRETFIQVEGYAVLDDAGVRAGDIVLPGEAVYIAESQERLKFQDHFGGCIHQLIAYHHLIVIWVKDDTLPENDFPNLVRDAGNRVCVEVHNVLVAAGLIDVPIAVDAQVKPLSAQDKALVQGTQQQVPVAIELLYRNGQEAVVTAGIARDYGRVAIRSGLVRQDNLPLKRVREIDELRLVEFQKSHKYVVIFASKPWRSGRAGTT